MHETFVLKGDAPTGHVHDEHCGCASGHQGDPGIPAPKRPRVVGYLAAMQAAKAAKSKKTELKPGRQVAKSVSTPTKKPKKKPRDWVAEIRQARAAGEE